MLTRVAFFSVLLAAALAFQPAAAQTLYKSTMPDGRVVYGDKPAPGADKVESSTPKASKKAGIVTSTPREAAAVKQMTRERQAREAAQDRLRMAEIALHDAEVAQAMGKEPQPGDRIGTAGGTQRFTDAYWERQKRLENAVAQARRYLDRVRSGK